MPEKGTKTFYTTNEELYWHTGENDVPKEWRMPSMFKGEGVR